MFRKILIANRGEIACRVMHTAKRLGVKTVAVYSEADASARHVAMADEAINIGTAPARESYLLSDKIIAAAQSTNAQAIHPGYGFLSENAAFARACGDHGLVFIGPPVAAIEAMGSKSAAKAIMENANVPLVPGYHGDDQDEAVLREEARKIGFPVLIKASAGGGGKGMRVVHEADHFMQALHSAKREAMSSFKEDQVLIERYLTNPRHIEIQVFCDHHGGAVHLFERDCSVQRRHQKVLEEAPAPGMDERKRTSMGDMAIAAAKAIAYQGAGTVEFIVDEDGAFYFMEMNTRLQVEHPVTECITGEDLVEWQLRIASGERLPKTQDELSINGHAVEVRVYAEDPGNDFLPSTGQISHLRFPAPSRHVRVDAGVRQGDTVTVHYDPMIAKLIVWDVDRNTCIQRMLDALSQTQVAGVSTNIEFLSSVISHPSFKSGGVNTGFIERYRSSLFADKAELTPAILSLATLYKLLERKRLAQDLSASSTDPGSPWHETDNWQLNLPAEEKYRFRYVDREHEVNVRLDNNQYVISADDWSIGATGSLDDNRQMIAALDKTRAHATVVEDDPHLTVFHAGHTCKLRDMSDLLPEDERQIAGTLISPVPGRIIDVMVSKSQRVKRGDPLLVLEAMKMEHTITAPHDGVVELLHYSVGDRVDDGVELLQLNEAQESMSKSRA